MPQEVKRHNSSTSKYSHKAMCVVSQYIGGTDFIDEPRMVTIAAGDTEACTRFVVVDDSLALEGDETFVVDFEVPSGVQSGTPSTTTVTIIDDDRMLIHMHTLHLISMDTPMNIFVYRFVLTPNVRIMINVWKTYY